MVLASEPTGVLVAASVGLVILSGLLAALAVVFLRHTGGGSVRVARRGSSEEHGATGR